VKVLLANRWFLAYVRMADRTSHLAWWLAVRLEVVAEGRRHQAKTS
jgi:hypothetical protein